jgi:hypothetical protein
MGNEIDYDSQITKVAKTKIVEAVAVKSADHIQD